MNTRKLLLWIALAVATHLAAVWALPRVVMGRVLHTLAAEANPGPVFPPAADASARRIVMPSPDLLYALCRFDLSQGPFTVSAAPAAGAPYWSLAFYADNTDNFRVINHRQAGSGGMALRLLPPGQQPGNSNELQAPSLRGLVLMRVLHGGDAPSLQQADAARRTLACGKA